MKPTVPKSVINVGHVVTMNCRISSENAVILWLDQQCVNFGITFKQKFGSQVYSFLANLDTESLIVHVLGGNEDNIKRHVSCDDQTCFNFLAVCARSICLIYSA